MGTFKQMDVTFRHHISELTNAELRLLLVLFLHSDKAGECWPSDAVLLEKTGYKDKDTLFEAKVGLEQKGFIERKKERTNTGRFKTVYRVDLNKDSFYKSEHRWKEFQGLSNELDSFDLSAIEVDNVYVESMGGDVVRTRKIYVMHFCSLYKEFCMTTASRFERPSKDNLAYVIICVALLSTIKSESIDMAFQSFLVWVSEFKSRLVGLKTLADCCENEYIISLRRDG